MHTFVVRELRFLARTHFYVVFTGTVAPVARDICVAFLVLEPEAIFGRDGDILAALSRD